MKRSDVTYGQLDRTLRSLGFSSQMTQGNPPTRIYEHKETGASFRIPPFPDSDFVLEYHLVGARGIIDLFGVADPTVFDAQLRKAG